MSYLILQLWIFLLLAALIGLIAGWFLRGGARAKLNKANLEWSQRLANVEAERDEFSRKNSELNSSSVRQGDMFLKLSDERDVLSKSLLARESGSETHQKTVHEYQQRLSQHEVEVTQLKEQLSETANQLNETQQSLHVVRGQTKDGSLQLKNGSEQLNGLSVKLSESEKQLAERDQTIDQLHQKLATNLTGLNETKEGLSKTLDEEREKARAATASLEETKRLKEEYEEQLKCSENSLQEVTSELKQKQEFFEVNRRELDTKLKNSGEQFESANTSVREKDERLKQVQQTLEERELSLKSVTEKEAELQKTVNRMSEQLEQSQNALTESKQQAQQTVEARDLSLKSVVGKEAELQKTVSEMSGQLEQSQKALTESQQQQQQTQKALTESNQNQQNVVNELRASQFELTKLQNQSNASNASQESSTPQQPRDYSGIASGIMAGAVGTAAVAGSAVASKSDGLSSGWSKLSGMAKSGYQKVKVKVEDTTHDVVTATAKASPNDENYRIEVIRSIGNDNRRLLHDMGITTTTNLLDRCQDPQSIKLISKTLGRESWVVSSWASIADLLRVKGVDGAMAEVLELSGVYSVQSLADANPDKLLQSIKAVNVRVDKLGTVPDIAAIAGWIRHAGSLEEMIA